MTLCGHDKDIISALMDSRQNMPGYSFLDIYLISSWLHRYIVQRFLLPSYAVPVLVPSYERACYCAPTRNGC